MHSCLLFNVVDVGYLNRSGGIYRIATILRNEGLDVEVIDYSNFWTLEQLKQVFQSRHSGDLKFIGFSHLFSIWPQVLEDFCSWVKTAYPEIKIMSGSSVFPKFETEYIDYYIRGYGEIAMVELVKYMCSNGPRPRFMLDAPKGKKIIDANTNYPAYPMRSSVIIYEDRDFLEPDEWLVTEFARGCKFQCAFCNFPILGVKGDYTRDADDFELQMRDAYDRFGIQNYIVADETFNDRTEKITKFADVVERLGFDTFFSGFIRADLLISRPKDREELLRMNFLGQFYGVETFHPTAAKAIGKGMDPDRVKEGLVDLKKYFTTHGKKQYRATLALIFGLPGEDFESLDRSKKWLIDNWQTQNFLASWLDIPKGQFEHPSKMSLDYKKYGYVEILEQELAPLERAKTTGHGADVMYWQNDQMNFYQARDLVEDFIKIKDTHDFRTGSFALGHRLKRPYTVGEVLDMTWDEQKDARDYSGHIERYIAKKLSI